MAGRNLFVVSMLFGLMFYAWPAKSGSLYQEKNYRDLVSDHRACRVGDTLTVQVYENSSATTTADTTTSSSSGVTAGLTTVSTDKSLKADLGSTSSGTGKILRSGKLLAQLSVTVNSIAPNGDLLVKGEQLIEVNGEKQKIALVGRVRPQDIGDNNTVASNRMADAKISYVGDGLLGDQQAPSWFARIGSFLLKLF